MSDASKQKFPKYFLKPEVLNQIPTDGHCVIEASAGTGKTYTLVRLYLDLILTGKAKVEEILVATFTRKATAELRERLAAIIDDALAAKDTKPKEGDFWEINDAEMERLKTAKRDFYKATISTLDSMTHRIISDNHDLVDLDANAEPSTEGVKAEAFARFMREDVPKNDLLKDMLYAFDKYDAQDSDVISLEDGYNSAGVTLRKMLEEQTAQDCVEVDVDPVLLGDKGLEHKKSFLALLASTKEKPLTGARILAIRHAWTGSKRAQGSGLDDELVFLELLNNGAECRWLLAANYFAKIRKEWKNIESKQGVDDDPKFEEAWIFLYNHSFYLDEFVAAYARPLYLEKLKACKEAFGLYDYDDFTQALAKTLKGKPQLANRVRDRWKIAIVDEFQDTSPAQWDILKRCFFDEAGGRLFVIGDPKQAIYGFRGADIYTYREALELIKNKVCLNDNYRSTPKVVDVINAFFTGSLFRTEEERKQAGLDMYSLFQEKPTETKVFYNAYETVDAGHKDWVCKDLKIDKELSALGLLTVDCEVNKKVADRLGALSQAIVDEIECLLYDENFKIGRESINSEGKIEWRDIQKIYILGRNHKDFERIKPLLVKAGIPFESVSSSYDSLFNVPEIYELTWIMLAIENPTDRSLIAAALNTSLFGVCLPDIAGAIDVEHSPYLPLFSDWSKKANKGQFSQVFEEILSKSQYRERLSLYGYGDEAYHNVVSAIDYLLAQAAKKNLAWTDLCELLGELRRGELKAELSSEPDPQKVSLMTIHSCKGLEADVVFLLADYDYGKVGRKKASYYHRKSEDAASKSEDAASSVVRALRPYQTNTGGEEADILEQELEEERLLYVTMTRASLRLYLPFYKNIKEPDKPKKERKDRLSRLQFACKKLPPDVEVAAKTLVEIAKLAKNAAKVQEEAAASPLASQVTESSDPKPSGSDQEKGVCGGLNDVIKAKRDELSRANSKPTEADYPKPQRVSSYSSLEREGKRNETLDFSKIWESVSSDQKAVRESWLPRGTTTGTFLHKLLEDIDFSFVQQQHKLNCSADNWLSELSAPGVEKAQQMFKKTADAYGFVAKALVEAQRLVFLALTTSIPVHAPDGLCGVNAVTKELEFLCSKKYSSSDWPKNAENSSYLKGFIDLLYWQGDKLYALDWKSDTLDDYRPDALRKHVQERYQGQVDIYSFAVRRWLSAMGKDPDESYGGMLYVFLRGLKIDSNDGFCFFEPNEQKAIDEAAI